MKTKSFLLLFIFSNYVIGCSAGNKLQDTGQVVIRSYASNNPILKGMQEDGIVRLDFNIPTNTSALKLSNLKYSINDGGIENIEKINIYLSESTAFLKNNLLASFSPTSVNANIPLTLNLGAGIHYIWVSVVLRANASLMNKIDFRCLSFQSNDGKIVPIDQGLYNYSKYTGIAVRKGGDDNVNTYRIPGLISTDKGTLLSVYDIRYANSGDLPGNIDVGLSRSTDGGQTWAPMKVIMDMGLPNENNGVGDPAILIDPVTKKIYVAALWSKGNRSIAGSLPGISPDSTGQLVLVSSDDDGLTWSKPYTITPQVKNPFWNLFFNGPGSGIAMQDGTLVFAAQYWDEKKMPYSTIIYSKDQGKSWIGSIFGPKSNTTESQVVETIPGTLMLNMRDNRGSYRSVATTTNLGATWTEHTTSYKDLPDPICMGSLIKAKVNVKGVLKEVLFFSNPNTNSGRYNITIKASLDLGQTWLPANQLLIDERSCYGYSCLTRIDENTIGILYEGVKDLYFVKIKIGDIIK